MQEGGIESELRIALDHLSNTLEFLKLLQAAIEEVRELCLAEGGLLSFLGEHRTMM